MRKPMIAGNWKMNKTPAETVALVEDLKKIQVRTKAEVVVCPMTVSLFAAASSSVRRTSILRTRALSPASATSPA